MHKPPTKRITIYLSLDRDILCTYFNKQDPAPLYKRQLSQDFEQYIMACIRSAKRESAFSYKVSYTNEEEKEYAEPLIYAIRRHFADSKALAVDAFDKFKQRSYKLLFASLAFVIISQGFGSLLLDEHNRIHTGLHNSLDVLCWVVLWKPMERLIFYWNPFLKDISILNKLEKAEVTFSEVEKL